MPATLIRSVKRIKPYQQGCVLTMGNFDGVHLGHQQLVRQTMLQAKSRGVRAAAMTFEPHAFEFFSMGKVTIPRLTRLREKYHALSRLGLDDIIITQFNHELASMSASDFVHRLLASAIRPCHIVVGDDFHFGCQRSGNVDLLSEMGQSLGFTVEAIPTVLSGDERISSTRVRKLLAEGALDEAAQLLGRPYAMEGRIVKGDQRGRQMGFPTANIFLHRHLTPVKGVYVVKMRGVDANSPDKSWPGVANIGERPTFDGTRTLLEVHLFDFNQDIYGQYVSVEFCEKVRDEVRFNSFDDLKNQIAKDVQVARDYFKKSGVL